MTQSLFSKMNFYLKQLKYNKYFIFFFLLFSKYFIVYAALDGQPPSLNDLKEILSRIVGLFLAASAAALIIMVGYGIIKGSLAAGDPRALEGAKGTWSYAVFGFFIVILSITLVNIIRKVLGIEGSFVFAGFLDNIVGAFNALVTRGQQSN